MALSLLLSAGEGRQQFAQPYMHTMCGCERFKVDLVISSERAFGTFARDVHCVHFSPYTSRGCKKLLLSIFTKQKKLQDTELSLATESHTSLFLSPITKVRGEKPHY